MNDPAWQVTWHSLRDLLGSKWSFHVLRLLHSGPHGFNEMKRAVDGMTATMLSRRLKELECQGFVDRSVEETTPPTTTYRLTEGGAEFGRLLAEMEGLTQVARCGDQPACGGSAADACVDGGAEGACVTLAECV